MEKENLENQVSTEINGEQQAQQEENQPTTREVFEKRIRDKYPDLDEEGIYSHAMKSYDGKKKDLTDMQTASGEIIDLLENNPDSIDFFQAINETGDVEDALLSLPRDVLQRAVERIDNGEKLSDNEKEEKIIKHRENILARKNLKKTVNGNKDKSLKAIEEYAKEMGTTPEEVIKGMQPIIDKLINNDIDKDVLNMFFYKDILNKEYNRGITEGKNKRIEDKELKKRTSGLPQVREANIGVDKNKKSVVRKNSWERLLENSKED